MFMPNIRVMRNTSDQAKEKCVKYLQIATMQSRTELATWIGVIISNEKRLILNLMISKK